MQRNGVVTKSQETGTDRFIQRTIQCSVDSLVGLLVAMESPNKRTRVEQLLQNSSTDASVGNQNRRGRESDEKAFNLESLCAKCRKPLNPKKETVALHGELFHFECFVCSDCGTQLSTAFGEREGVPYCHNHFSKRIESVPKIEEEDVHSSQYVSCSIQKIFQFHIFIIKLLFDCSTDLLVT